MGDFKGSEDSFFLEDKNFFVLYPVIYNPENLFFKNKIYFLLTIFAICMIHIRTFNPLISQSLSSCSIKMKIS